MAVKHDIHDGKGGKITVKTSPIKAIRLFCIECMGYQVAEIPRCSAPLCPLFPYKMGDAHKEMSAEQRKRIGDATRERAKNKSPQPKVVQESTISEGSVG